ncbi:hypothetical protein [Pseudonocardia acidicola]|uniref:Uncharacterized protein n=1 Tax=Pseudonocardia acidicola TaxID=2724939 RepID=A0ABX1S3J8_9PSEU|nr:hypothetical protein [Pseudonocardia acidicola]NMH96156.1 hypothetical protein [Pseudonocardia acidicola]
MDEIAITPAMTAILRDLTYWHTSKVRILRVDASPDHGVRLSVSDLTPAIEQQLRHRYSFPVTCSPWEPLAPAPTATVSMPNACRSNLARNGQGHSAAAQ